MGVSFMNEQLALSKSIQFFSCCLIALKPESYLILHFRILFKNLFSLYLGRIKGFNDIYHTLSLCLLFDCLLNAVKCLVSLSHGNPIYGIKSPSFAWLTLVWLHRLHACFTKGCSIDFYCSNSQHFRLLSDLMQMFKNSSIVISNGYL